MKNPATWRAGEPMFQAEGRASTKALGQEKIHCLLLERPKEAKMVGYGVLESLQVGMEKSAEPGQAKHLTWICIQSAVVNHGGLYLPIFCLKNMDDFKHNFKHTQKCREEHHASRTGITTFNSEKFTPSLSPSPTQSSHPDQILMQPQGIIAFLP